MVTIKLSKVDAETVALIVAEKAVEMHKKGAEWHRNGEYLSCVGMGKIANKIRKPIGGQYDFESFFSGKKNKKVTKPTKHDRQD